ncbi:histidinol phosphate phosphatase domain-containing protein [Gracilibacillus alcaliphilus]|uniref:histidinol phosphate phosphatase domain-containing protein n=1 Tax=Gracilibacillus alcaliphilus TaxID=1401441 RepID=UPI001958EAC6|nr:histidinol phosphate phosphatase domain-containing protein [Gracilibacillus alcaliphilus]MBM7676533.1 histidinol-phosphatase (PHP family) [Gracilibacillus alcaliphilus]
MKVDSHIHLEEGPYTHKEVAKITQSLEHFAPLKAKRHTKEWFTDMLTQVQQRMEKTEYSEWWLDFYLERAKQRDLKVVGIVDHLYRFTETRDYFEQYIDVESEEIGVAQQHWLDCVMTHSLPEFVDFIEGQKEKWNAHGIELKLGIEADYFVGGEAQLQALLQPYPFDYVIGSVHFYDGWGFDNPGLQSKFQAYDLLDLYKNHFETVKKAAASGLFDIIAHLDNLKVFNHRPDEALLSDIYLAVAQALKEANVATEINPGLYYRYPVQEMCPSDAFLDILAAEGVVFTTSSDSHFPHDIGIFADHIQARLKEREIYEIAVFDKRVRKLVSIED